MHEAVEQRMREMAYFLNALRKCQVFPTERLRRSIFVCNVSFLSSLLCCSSRYLGIIGIMRMLLVFVSVKLQSSEVKISQILAEYTTYFQSFAFCENYTYVIKNIEYSLKVQFSHIFNVLYLFGMDQKCCLFVSCKQQEKTSFLFCHCFSI